MTEIEERKRHAQAVSTVRAWWRGPGSSAVHAVVPHDVRDALDHLAYYGPEIVEAISSGSATAYTKPATTTAPPSFSPLDQSLPVTMSEVIYNDDGFGVGFRVVHPPGVECVFPPNTKQCSCGKMDLGVIDPASTERSPSQS